MFFKNYKNKKYNKFKKPQNKLTAPTLTLILNKSKKKHHKNPVKKRFMIQYNRNRAAFLAKSIHASENNKNRFNNIQILIKLLAQSLKKNLRIKRKKVKKNPIRKFKLTAVLLKNKPQINPITTPKPTFNIIKQPRPEKKTPTNNPIILSEPARAIIYANTLIKNIKNQTKWPHFVKSIHRPIKRANLFNSQKKKTKKHSLQLLFKSYNTEHLLNYVNTKHAAEHSFTINIPLHKDKFYQLIFKHKFVKTPNQFISVNVQSRIPHAITLTNYFPLIYYFYQPHLLSQQAKKQKAQLYNYYIQPLTNYKFKALYNFFLVNFLENFLQKKIWVRADSRSILNKKHKTYCYIAAAISVLGGATNKWINRLVPLYELLEIIVIMFLTRDLQIFLWFVKNCLERTHFKKHKKILLIIFDMLRKNKQLLIHTAVRGFFFDIRGKVGVSGNAKKRHVSFSLNKITTTSQNIKSQWQQINVWTPTGQMGITCYILY